MLGPKKPRSFKPSGKRLLGPKKVLTEAEYRQLLRAGRHIPQGALVQLGKVPAKSLKRLKIRFRADGSVELPYYAGPEAKLHRVKILHPKTVPEAIRLVNHQISSVKLRAEQARMIFDEVARLHWDLEHKWRSFNEMQRNAFTEYFYNLLGHLAKNPTLLQDEHKIHAGQRFERARQLLQEGNVGAASATMAGIKNNMRNWLRKLRLQAPRLERRRSLVVDRKFQMDERIFSSVDSLIRIFNQLVAGIEPRARERVAKNLSQTAKRLYATGLSAFNPPAIIVKKAADLVRKGKLAKARIYVKDANKKIILAASSISSIYPDKLREIKQSRDLQFKEAVLGDQTVLFHDMMPLWWNPKNRAKSELILETVTELSLLAGNLGKKDVAGQIADAVGELQKNNLPSFVSSFARAAVSLRPELAKEML